MTADRHVKNGLNVMRIFDALNDLDNVKESIRMINELGGIPDGFAHLAQTVPRRLVEITHYRVGHSTAPHFHDIEIGIFIQRQQPVNTGLRPVYEAGICRPDFALPSERDI